MDRTTRYGSCVPVTTIGIAPIFGPETSRRRVRSLSLQVYFNPVRGAIGSTGEAVLLGLVSQ
jgi:hypothetical protein